MGNKKKKTLECNIHIHIICVHYHCLLDFGFLHTLFRQHEVRQVSEVEPGTTEGWLIRLKLLLGHIIHVWWYQSLSVRLFHRMASRANLVSKWSQLEPSQPLSQLPHLTVHFIPTALEMRKKGDGMWYWCDTWYELLGSKMLREREPFTGPPLAHWESRGNERLTSPRRDIASQVAFLAYPKQISFTQHCTVHAVDPCHHLSMKTTTPQSSKTSPFGASGWAAPQRAGAEV